MDESSKVELKDEQGSLAFSRTEDGGLLIEHEIRFVDGQRDHLRLMSKLSPINARRVFDLLAQGES